MAIPKRKSGKSLSVRAVVLDWAGTAVDFGSIAPAAVFADVFQRFGISLAVAQVRQFMGLAKIDHIRRLCALPVVSARWRDKHGMPPTPNDIDRLYALTETLMAETAARYADPIPGLLEATAALRSQGIKIGTSTGYTAPIMEKLAPAAAQKGYIPDTIVCSSDVPDGRPYPWMCYLNAIQLQVYPLETMVKIGDTISDIEAGRNAGMWTVGLSQSGNEMGLSEGDLARLGDQERQTRTEAISTRFRTSGAHYVVDGIWNVPPAIADINGRLARGESP